jgi:PGF-CTERM protein
MKRLFRLLLAAVVIGWLFAAPVGAATTGSQVTLTVSVVDQGDVAVGDAEITASWDGGETTQTTASNGRAFVDVPAGEDVTVEVEHEDYVRNEPVVVEDAEEQDVTVRVALKGNSIVTVENADGQALADATVQFRRDGEVVLEGKTGGDGVFETGTIEQGYYDVHAVKPGFLREQARYRVGIDTERTFQLERGRVRLDVSVVDDHFDPPRELSDARVRLSDAEGEVATVRTSGGVASLDVDVNNRYRLTVLEDGYVESTTRVSVSERARSVEAATQRLPNLTVQRQNNRVVVGEETRLTLLNAYDEPVEGAEIRHDGRTVAETDANGEAVVAVESEGPQNFTAVTDAAESAPIVVEGIDPEGDGDGESTEASPAETEADLPGFGALAAVLGVLGAVLLAARR